MQVLVCLGITSVQGAYIMDVPTVVTAQSFQEAWLKAVKILMKNDWHVWNLIVQTTEPESFNEVFHEKVRIFAKEQNFRSPKGNAYIIFPFNLYDPSKGAQDLFDKYNNPRGLYERKFKRNWGTYFRRLSHVDNSDNENCQLHNLINAINNSDKVFKAAYTLIIQRPGKELVRNRGGPCLNYIAVQLKPGNPKEISLLCVYRNHDFLERAYGNYWGLTKLLQFIAHETDSKPKRVTCVSSHSYVKDKKRALKQLVKSLEE